MTHYDTPIISANTHHNLSASLCMEKFSQKFGYFCSWKMYIPIWPSTNTQIFNSSFVNINPPNPVGTANVSTLPAIITLFQSTLELSECSFKQNHISAVRAHASHITLTGTVIFHNNTAILGSAFIYISTRQCYKHCRIQRHLL